MNEMLVKGGGFGQAGRSVWIRKGGDSPTVATHLGHDPEE